MRPAGKAGRPGAAGWAAGSAGWARRPGRAGWAGTAGWAALIAWALGIESSKTATAEGSKVFELYQAGKLAEIRASFEKLFARVEIADKKLAGAR